MKLGLNNTNAQNTCSLWSPTRARRQHDAPSHGKKAFRLTRNNNVLNVGRFEAPLSICPPTIKGACRWGVDIKVKLVLDTYYIKKINNMFIWMPCYVNTWTGEVLQGLFTIKPSHEDSLYLCKLKTKCMEAHRLWIIFTPYPVTCKITLSIVITFKFHDVPVGWHILRFHRFVA